MKKRIETINNKRIVYSSDDNVIRKDEINIKNLINKNSNDVIVANQITIEDGTKTTAKIITELTTDMLYTATAEDVKKNSKLTANETYVLMPYNERIFYFCRYKCSESSKGAHKVLLYDDSLDNIDNAQVSDVYISFDWEDEANNMCALYFIGYGPTLIDTTNGFGVTAMIEGDRTTLPTSDVTNSVVINNKGLINGIVYGINVRLDENNCYIISLIKANIVNKTANCGNYKES